MDVRLHSSLFRGRSAVPKQSPLAQTLLATFAVAVSIGSYPALAGTITNIGDVSIEDGVINIGRTSDGLRLVDETSDGVYTGAVLGSSTGVTGDLHLQNSAVFTTLGELIIGRDGSANVTVSGGSRLVSENTQMGARTADWPDCCNSITDTTIAIEGTGSAWESTGLIVIGDQQPSSRRSLRLSAGADLYANGVRLLPSFSLAGPTSFNVTIEGTGTSWLNAGPLQAYGQVNYALLDGAHAVDNGVVIGADYSLARFVIDGTGTEWRTGHIRAGIGWGDGNAGIFIRNGGRVISESGYLSTQTAMAVRVDGPGSSWDVSGILQFGGNAAGGNSLIEVTNGALLKTVDARLTGASGFGRVNLSGAGSRWVNDGTVMFGLIYQGSEAYAGGGISVRQEAQFLSSEISVSCLYGTVADGQPCELLVSDSGSKVHSSGNVNIGGDAVSSGLPALMTVQSGGVVSAEDAVRVWGRGKVRVDGGLIASPSIKLEGGMLEGRGHLIANLENRGRVAPLRGGGALEISGSYVQDVDGTLSIELAPDGTTSLLDVLGVSVLAGELEVLISDGFAPQLGEKFEILRYAHRFGEFDSYVVAGLADGLSLAPEYGDYSLVLRVVPEPTIGLLMGLGLIGMSTMRPKGHLHD